MKKLILLLLITALTITNLFAQTATAPSAGDGSAGNPYQIATLENLYWIAANSGRWNFHYIQIADIDASATSGWFSGEGWKPIGTSGFFSFRGSYNGQGHLIEKLHLSRSLAHVGLFGFTHANAEIGNLGLLNVNIQGQEYVGGLIGTNSGTVEDCFATGIVSSDVAAGGLIGYNTGFIYNSYSRCSVSGQYAGGLVPFNEGHVDNCYSTGSVSGNEIVGGLIAWNLNNVSNSYWDTESSGQTGSDGGTGRTTAQMKDQGTFSGWDFADTWVMVSTSNDGYPSLQWQVGYIWSGSSTAWGSGGNWNTGSVPGSSASVVIPGSISHYPVMTDNRTINKVEIQLGASLTVGSTGQFTITGNIINNAGTGGFLVESDASSTGSVILNNSISGTVQRYVTGGQWHIVSPPVSGQGINAFLSNIVNDIPKNSNNEYAMTEYDEDRYSGSGSWAPYFTSSTAGNLVTGKGYLIGPRSPGAALEFTGTPGFTNTSIGITRAANGWNAIGNPFPSAIGVRSNAASAANFLTANEIQMDPAHVAIYLYNPAINDYEAVNNSTGQSYIQPGQGFMVRAPLGGGNISFTTGMRIHNQSSGFVKKSAGAPWPVIRLSAVSGDHNTSTLITFNSNMTRGLDPSYDAGQYSTKPEFRLYTRLADGSSEINFAIQALPDYGFDDMVIPIGFDFKDGGKVTFSVSELQLPDGAAAILEDRALNLFINLAEKNYVVELEPDSSGTGRFFIHTDITITGTTKIEPDGRDKLHLYSYGKEIIIEGPVDMNTRAAVYDLTGRQLRLVQLNGSDRNSFRVDELERGIYIVRVVGGSINQSVKVYIE